MDISKLRIHQQPSRDIISALFETETPMAIHNIYNPHTDGSTPNARYYGIPGNSVIPKLDQKIHTYRTHEQIVVGDLNMQHHDWTGQEERNGPTNQTTCLRETFQRAVLEQCVPVGTITRPPDRANNEGTTIDLVWATEGTRTAMISCGVQHDMDCDSDHLPVETILDVSTPQRP